MSNTLDLFCGCGGLTTGLIESNLNIVASIDIWDKAIESIKKNHNQLSICADLVKYNLPEIHVIVGGPPLSRI